MSERMIGDSHERCGAQGMTPTPQDSLIREANHIRSVHLLFVALMLMAGVMWGMKLEWRIDVTNAAARENETRIGEVERTINRGTLPLTEERLNKNSTRLEQIASDHRDLLLKMEGLAAAMERLKTEEAQNQLIIERLRSDQTERRKRAGG